MFASLRLGRNTAATLRRARPAGPVRRLPVRLLMVAGLVAAILGACSGSATPAASGGPSILATTTVFADIVHQVAGTRFSVASIVPSSVDPHEYEPKPDDAKRVAAARLIVSNGLGVDEFLDELLTTTGSQSARLVLSDGIDPIVDAGEANPHVWLDPTLVRDHFVPAIVAKLSELDPAGADTFKKNGDAYKQQLTDLDKELLDKVAKLPAANRKLVLSHDAFPYFARHFGFETVGVILDNPGQDPSAGELAALVKLVKAAGVKAIFSEAQFSPKLAQTLAEEAGVKEVVTDLYTDALGPAPEDSYIGIMRWDVDRVVKALG